MTGLEIVTALGAISACIAVIKPSVERKDDKLTIAIERLNEAVTETEKYFQYRDESPQTEYTLNRVWNSASNAFEQAGYPKLAKLALIKGGYWLNPNDWTSEDVEASGIQLSEMRKRLEEALK